MKFSLVLLLIQVAFGAHWVHAVPLDKHYLPLTNQNYHTRGLHEDLNDLLALIPVDKITDIFFEYLSNDEDFGEVLDYLLSDEFKPFVIEVEAMPEVKDLLNMIQDAGVDAYDILNMFNDLLGIEKIHPEFNFELKLILGGLSGFVQDIKAVLPLDKIEKLVKAKLQTSKDYIKLVSHLNSKKSQDVISKIMAHPKLQHLIKLAEAKGLIVQELLDLFTTISGIHVPSLKPGYFVTHV